MQLKIKDLTVKVNNQIILDKFNLNIEEGKITAIMGPNGVGKSTLSKVIMGDKNYQVINGDILVDNQSILPLSVDKRSKLGIFLAMQNPVEIDGVSNQDFLRTALSIRENKHLGLYDFINQCEDALEDLKMNKKLIHRSLNIGFSGGEKKKNEVLQIKLLKPSLIILDEIDSGLDVDSLRIVANNILEYFKDNQKVSLLIITHHHSLLEYLKPDYVHVLYNKKIITSGNYDLALDIEQNGYKKYLDKINDITEEKIHE